MWKMKKNGHFKMLQICPLKLIWKVAWSWTWKFAIWHLLAGIWRHQSLTKWSQGHQRSNGKLFVLGGKDGNGYLSTTELMEIDSALWWRPVPNPKDDTSPSKRQIHMITFSSPFLLLWPPAIEKDVQTAKKYIKQVAWFLVLKVAFWLTETLRLR